MSIKYPVSPLMRERLCQIRTQTKQNLIAKRRSDFTHALRAILQRSNAMANALASAVPSAVVQIHVEIALLDAPETASAGLSITRTHP
jgi:mevalonate pyrophosphate decarboxylase